MFRSIKSMSGIPIEATDGHIGKVDQFYFDDQSWAIRYLVADIGTWLNGRKVLISPTALDRTVDDIFKVNATKDQISNSPDVDTASPVSRQKEVELHDYYAWPYYWLYPGYYNSLGGAIFPGLTTPAGLMPEDLDQTFEESGGTRKEERSDVNHLRSTREIIGYRVQARDEMVGRVDDFIVMEEGWVLRYIVIDTRENARKVLYAPQWTRGIDWDDALVYTEFTHEVIRNGPGYDIKTIIDRDFENRIFDYYGRPKYWND